MKNLFSIALLLTLLWEHDGAFLWGFVVERTTDLKAWEQVGIVAAADRWRTNATDFTYRWQSDTEPASGAYYRVGAVEE